MRNEFTAIIERDGDCSSPTALRSLGANGQGKTKEEARESLAGGDRVDSRGSSRGWAAGRSA